MAYPLYSPGDQCSGNRCSPDREGWQPNAIDQRHGERRHEATAKDGTRDDLPITVAFDDVGLPRRVDHVHHHEAAGEHALGFAELGNRMLEPVLPKDVPPDHQSQEHAPANRCSRQNYQRADVRANGSQRQCADRADDHTIHRDPAESFDRATIHGPFEIVPSCAELEAGPRQVFAQAQRSEKKN